MTAVWGAPQLRFPIWSMCLLRWLAWGALGRDGGLFQGEWVFGFDSAEFAYRESAAGVALQVFDVGAASCAGLFQGLYGAVAIFAAHNLAALGESFVEGARHPAAAYFDLALRHDRRFLSRSHG